MKCPNCSANLDLSGRKGGVVTCGYCDHQIQLAALGQGSSAKKGVPVALPTVAVAALVLVGIGAGLAFSLQRGPSQSMPGPQEAPPALAPETALSEKTQPETMPSEPEDTAAEASPGAPAEEANWDEVGGPPQIANIQGDEHVVGRVRVRPGDHLRVVVIRSRDLQQRWATPDLGTYGDAYRGVHFQVGDGLLALTDGKNHLRIFELESGKEIHSLPLSDRAQQLCASKDGKTVWVQSLDKRHVRFDLQAQKSRRAQKWPSHCPESKVRDRKKPKEGVRSNRFPRIPDFKAKHLLVEGDDAVVFGTKAPGTAIPIAAGFSQKDKKLRWQQSVIQVPATAYRGTFFGLKAGLSGGRFATFYGAGSDDEWHTVALDAKTGDVLWDTKLKPIFAVDIVAGITVTPEFVYLVRTSSLDILDAKTGAYVGTVGEESYD
jgi:outer membrane protein assembly factor BamB